MPVQVQLLGGDSGRMAGAAVVAWKAGALGIDINFGCPARTVNRHDGGASLLQHPARIRAIVKAVRDALPKEIPVSAKLRLGWDCIDAIHENAEMAADGGADWLTIHARTRVQGYAPPVYWRPIRTVRERLGLPVVANGDIWSIEDFRQCREETGCRHFMLGRGALANPLLPMQAAQVLGLAAGCPDDTVSLTDYDWFAPLHRLSELMLCYEGFRADRTVLRLKQWLRIAALQGNFTDFERIKTVTCASELFAILSQHRHRS